EGKDRHRPSALQPLVALHAAQRVVLRLALLPGEPDAVDAAIALVDERVVVDEPVGDWRTAHGVRARPVYQHRDEDVIRQGDHGVWEEPDHEDHAQKANREAPHVDWCSALSSWHRGRIIAEPPRSGRGLRHRDDSRAWQRRQRALFWRMNQRSLGWK